jgi:hypothetical protein
VHKKFIGDINFFRSLKVSDRETDVISRIHMATVCSENTFFGGEGELIWTLAKYLNCLTANFLEDETSNG